MSRDLSPYAWSVQMFVVVDPGIPGVGVICKATPGQKCCEFWKMQWTTKLHDPLEGGKPACRMLELKGFPQSQQTPGMLCHLVLDSGSVLR